MRLRPAFRFKWEKAGKEPITWGKLYGASPKFSWTYCQMIYHYNPYPNLHVVR